jgi:spermidine synthase
LRLQSLDETGRVVGTLSAVGTAGAIFGTFVTGFVLIAALPGTGIVLAIGAGLVVAGVVLWAPPRSRALQAAVVPTIAAVALLVLVDGPCDEETTYFCAYVEVDDDRATGRTLWLDALPHSYVDLADPTHLEFRYARVMGDVLATLSPGPLDALFIGGGGFTLPRYLAAVRPGSHRTVLEIDPALVDLVADELGLDPDRPDLDIVTGDGRVRLRERPEAAFDVVIGDAFGGRSVPWHLTTREFVTDIRDRLRPGGIYLLNLIDQPPLAFARAEVATIAAVFRHVAVIAPPEYLARVDGGNFVVAASDFPLDPGAIAAAIAARRGEEAVVAGPGLSEFVDGARVLRDEHAPVDQLISSR